MERYTDEMKLWLFDLAHGNLNDSLILRGFVKHYVLNGCVIGNVQDDILFHTNYGIDCVSTVMTDLKRVLTSISFG